MKFLILVFAGLALIFTGNNYAVVVGCCVALAGIVTFTVAKIFKENTGDVKGDLARLSEKHGGTVKFRNKRMPEAAPAGIGDVLQFQRANREILFSVPRFTGTAATGGGGGGLKLLVNTALTVNTKLDLRVGRKTLLRQADQYAGSDCVFYGAETIKVNGNPVLVAGKDKNIFIAAVRHDRQLADAVETILFVTGYDEFRIGTGGEKILKLAKRYARNDTNPERVIAVFDAAVTIMNKLDTEEMAARTKPHPPEKERAKGVSPTFIVVITVIIAIFIYSMVRISSV